MYPELKNAKNEEIRGPKEIVARAVELYEKTSSEAYELDAPKKRFRSDEEVF